MRNAMAGATRCEKRDALAGATQSRISPLTDSQEGVTMNMKEIVATILMEARYTIHRAAGNVDSSRHGFFITIIQPEIERYYSNAPMDRF
jgi:hypothetical protein